MTRRFIRGALALIVGLAIQAPVFAQAIDPVARGVGAAALVQNAPTNSIPNVTNFTPSSLPRYRTKLASAIASPGSPVTICMVGDSTTMGATNATTALKATSWPAQLAKLYRGIGLSVAEDSITGDNSTPGTGTAGLTAYDPKAVFAGSTWLRNTDGLGGNMIRNTSGTDIFAYTPAASTDTIDTWYAQNSGNGTFTVSDGATLLSTINSGSPTTTAFIKATSTRTASANPINFVRTGAGGAVYLGLVSTWSSTTTQVKIFNFGRFGKMASDFTTATSPWSPLNSIPVVGCDLITINLGINEVRQNVAVATYTANMQTLITAYKASGADVILVRYHPDGAPVNPGLLPSYYAAQVSLAQNNNLPMVDLTARFVSYAVGNGQGEYGDSVHLLANGNVDVAMAVWSLLKPQ
jgi:lysophospholipase L1-like esterase